MSSGAPGNPGARAFAFPVSVYYEDTDAGGVVYYANYLKFMERARTEWLASLGLPLAAFVREHQALFVVQRACVDFLRPARLNDRLVVTVEVLDRGASRLVLAQRITRAGMTVVPGEAAAGEAARLRREPVASDEAISSGDTIASGQITLACVHADTLKPRRMPAVLAAALAQYPSPPDNFHSQAS